jgi:hypothetical protein
MTDVREEFIEWFRPQAPASYVARNWESHLDEIEEKFKQTYNYSPFDQNIPTNELVKRIKNSLEGISSNNNSGFGVYNKARQNGIPAAILGKTNYLQFLSERDNQTKIIITKDSVTTENIKDFEFSYDYFQTHFRNKKIVSIYKNYDDETRRNLEPGERNNSAIILARLALQKFEKSLDATDDIELNLLKTDAKTTQTGLWRSKEDFVWNKGNPGAEGSNPDNDSDKYVRVDWINGFPSSKNAKYWFYNVGLFDSCILAQTLLQKFDDDGKFVVTVLQNDDYTQNTEEDNMILDKITEIIENQKCKQLVLTGAPGTGKTYSVKEYVAKQILGKQYKEEHAKQNWKDAQDSGRVQLVQFHPSYDYTDFIEGYRPDKNGNFELKSGIFKKFCDGAKGLPDETCYFIIDEINRADLSKVFGEVMMGLEEGYRNQEISTQYSSSPDSSPLVIPSNVIILATMNDIDRSVESFDFALRRRFRWLEIDADDFSFLQEGTDEKQKQKAINEVIAGKNDCDNKNSEKSEG